MRYSRTAVTIVVLFGMTILFATTGYLLGRVTGINPVYPLIYGGCAVGAVTGTLANLLILRGWWKAE